ncbi:2OG-Fe(II) oxygenase [Brasilonema octagenarum UFV-E1]|uniref:2OG-Fe(II) oxygenase n=1 Tax=Brasilonema sennae CENA114 TaxID=415709 RepID=A0A856MLE4_9CYAN|nr:2OG-Fe(II) oxygenase [Brasilonema sennae]QDL10007.1 2OG-Fe(II) oxygenase [Brasilonema sennae CENA114]QDL16360.1 2OG-Fe(II) oxygenase [Brasilonema octagenarum UFV-E1]
MKTLATQVRNKLLMNVYEFSLIKTPAEFAYQAALAKHMSHLPILSSTDQAIVETLNNEGLFITSLEELSIPFTSEILEAAKNLMPKIPRVLCDDEKEFVIHATTQQIMEYPEIFLWGLQQRLLNIAENYFGLPVAYHGAYFRRDLVNEVQKKSRLWHMDREDRKLFKVIIYLNDINDDGGPFQYIPKDITSKVADSLGYKSGYIRDESIQRFVSPSNYKSCTGPSGTVVIAGTSNIFHRGKVPVTDDRFTIFFDYTSRQPKFPFYCKSSLPMEDLDSLSPMFSEHQKRCVFWREES